ncbi:MAG TPA: PEP-CTERM/exosortase system-associated acyltransferase [Rhizomicrobium sp.]|jgi:N-acyl amino acid synthase of PEP-CTERM/exosortase system|nr:PEP-CTERM/exosortase system-associated acyltransferase [Rhizomicrobium sp.]
MGAIDKIFLEKALEGSAQTWQPELSLLARHDVYFETRIADQPSLSEAAHALRYQVYCLERRFENADEHSDGLEIDAFDAHAIQGLLFHRPTDRAIGTVRLILPGYCTEGRLPIEQMLRANNIDLADFVRIGDSVEVSRFAISKEFRRRWTDDCAIAAGRPLSSQETARQANLACLSLIQFLVRQSVERRVHYWTAVMEATFLRMLARMGIHFTGIGPVVFHHGFRQPCYCYLPSMLERLRFEQRDYWEVITNGGELSSRLTLQIDAPVRKHV